MSAFLFGLSTLFWLALSRLVFVRIRTLLAYFQQEEYDAARFATAWRERHLWDVVASGFIIGGFVVALLTRIPIATPLFGIVGCLIAAWREGRYRFKKPLVLTPRAKRIALLATGLGIAAALIVFFSSLLAVLALQALPLALSGANAILKPGEDRRNQRYVDEAVAKLAEYKGVRIGVTGSFGKTSVKHILAQLLNLDGNVFYSRGSINTVLGLTRHIRQRMQPAHKYFVAEMGAYRRGSITRLCEFVKPEVGIITAVGEAHLERFGSVAETAKAKAELAEWVCAHGRLVVVTEAVAALEPFAKLIAAHPDKFLVCGGGAYCDVRIVSTALTANGLSVDVETGGKAINFVSPLLGEYNALNICLALAVASELAPEIADFLPAQVAQLEQVPHRLQKKESSVGPLMLDDAYNSNERGFREAVQTARKLADLKGGRAVLVTPGIVELGSSHDEVHAALGTLAGEACDDIYVVNPDRIPSFVSAAQAGRARVVTAPRLADARAAMARETYGSADVVLYENDLPDVLEDARLL